MVYCALILGQIIWLYLVTECDWDQIMRSRIWWILYCVYKVIKESVQDISCNTRHKITALLNQCNYVATATVIGICGSKTTMTMNKLNRLLCIESEVLVSMTAFYSNLQKIVRACYFKFAIKNALILTFNIHIRVHLCEIAQYNTLMHICCTCMCHARLVQVSWLDQRLN